MLNFHLEAYTAIAPGLGSDASWQRWFKSPSISPIDADLANIKQVPSMLRRRFKLLGKTASVAALNIINPDDMIPSIFASRHGDTDLTLSLLQDITNNEPISPAGFSLAVHNAVGGLLSIARQDNSPMTALSGHEGLVINTLIEAQAQLTTHERVLCVLYDIPLPALYQPYSTSLPFPMAIAFIVSRKDHTVLLAATQTKHMHVQPETESDLLAFIKLMTGSCEQITCYANKQQWCLSTKDNHHAR